MTIHNASIGAPTPLTISVAAHENSNHVTRRTFNNVQEFASALLQNDARLSGGVFRPGEFKTGPNNGFGTYHFLIYVDETGAHAGDVDDRLRDAGCQAIRYCVGTAVETLITDQDTRLFMPVTDNWSAHSYLSVLGCPFEIASSAKFCGTRVIDGIAYSVISHRPRPIHVVAVPIPAVTVNDDKTLEWLRIVWLSVAIELDLRDATHTLFGCLQLPVRNDTRCRLEGFYTIEMPRDVDANPVTVIDGALVSLERPDVSNYFRDEEARKQRALARAEKEKWENIRATIKREEAARKRLDIEIETLNKSSSLDDIRRSLNTLLDANAGEGTHEATLDAIKHATKKTGKTINGLLKEEKAKRKPADDESSAKAKSNYKVPPNAAHFKIKTGRDSEFLISPDEDGDLFVYEQEGQYPQKLYTLWHVASGASYPDRNNSRGLRIEVLDRQGNVRTVDVPAHLLAQPSGNDVIEMLINAGLAMSLEGRKRILEVLLQSRPIGPAVYHRPGFRNGTFLLPTGDALFGDGKCELAADSQIGVTARAGSLDAWQAATHQIFLLAKAHPQRMAILAGLAGPLVNIAGDDPLAYFLAGSTTTAKSTAQALAVAHYANPKINDKGLFIRCNATKNALEAPIERASGTVLALDEVSKMPADELAAYLYMLQGRSGKQRLNKNGDLRDSRSWDGCAVLLSGETSLGQRLNEDGAVQNGGLSVRVLMLPTSDKNRLAEDKFTAVKDVLANFGWSGPAFIEAVQCAGLLDNPDAILDRVSALIDQLPHTVGNANLQRRRSARMVGYLWLAGQIAQEAGLIPATFDLEGLAKQAWKDALASDIAPSDPAQKAVGTVLDWLISNRGGAVRAWDDRDEGFREAVGWYGAIVPNADKTGVHEVYVIRADQLSVIGGKAADKAQILAALEKKGLLVRSANQKSRTWSGFPRLSKHGQYVVLRADGIDG
jgi:hypothetical protein